MNKYKKRQPSCEGFLNLLHEFGKMLYGLSQLSAVQLPWSFDLEQRNINII